MNLTYCYSSPNDDPHHLADLMFECASRMSPVQLDIPKEEFFLNFNLQEFSKKTEIAFQQYKKEIKNIRQEIYDSIKGISAEKVDEACHLLLIYFKEETDSLLKEFVNKYGKEMVEMEFYVFQIKMSKHNLRENDELVDKMSIYMNYSLIDKTDPRNLINHKEMSSLWFGLGQNHRM